MKMTATPAIMVPEGKIDGDQGQSAGKPRGGRERWIWGKKWQGEVSSLGGEVEGSYGKCQNKIT